MLFQFFIPPGFWPGLHKPQTIRAINTKLCIHNHATIGPANCSHTFGHHFSLGKRQRPTTGLFIRQINNFSALTTIVINNFFGLITHIPDHNFLTVIPLKNIKLIRCNHTTNHSLTQTIAGINRDQIFTVSAPASGSSISAKGSTGNNRINHAHDTHRQRSIFNGPLLFGLNSNGIISSAFCSGYCI